MIHWGAKMKIKLLVVLSIAFLLVSGCATPEQRAQRIIANYGPYCEGLGYTVNSNEWRNCIMNEHQRVSDYISRIIN